MGHQSRLALLFFTFSILATALPPLARQEKLITVLATNDIHGGVEATQTKDGMQGGMALWAGVANAIRKGIQKQAGENSGVLLVDAGDQFQGTLISNYDEGQLVFSAMNEAGYDAAIPGNHDYDFGPIGWLQDQGPDAKKRREALLRLVGLAKFPLLSANTFFLSSLKSKDGKPIHAQPIGCATTAASETIDWESADAPSFLKPYFIKEVAGVRVALIGLDHPTTPSTTTFDNVKDLCFADIETTYRRIRTALDDKADVFVLIIHHGNSKTEKALLPILESLTKEKRLVDAVISGHTHYYENLKINGVPLIQSGSGGLAFGRIDLIWDNEKKQLNLEKTRAVAGLRLKEKSCDPMTSQISDDFCKWEKDTLWYEGQPAKPEAAVQTLIAKARMNIAPLATLRMGHAQAELTRDRVKESPLANDMTDTFRKLSKADIATVNTGGLRNTIKQGDFTYEDLFRVLPFSNHGLVMGPVSVEKIIELVKHSIQTCGNYGAIMQSGLKVQFRRNCATSDKTGGLDPNAELVRVALLDGTVLYENGKITLDATKTFHVATLDFLAAGGDGFTVFKDVPKIADLNILRESMKDFFLKEPANFSGQTDGRWKNLLPDLEPERSLEK